MLMLQTTWNSISQKLQDSIKIKKKCLMLMLRLFEFHNKIFVQVNLDYKIGKGS